MNNIGLKTAGLPWTSHIDPETVPWAPLAPGLDLRVLEARPADNLIVTLSRHGSNHSYGLHRHLGPLFGYTVSGAWGHEAGSFPYTEGVYLREPIGVVHRFFNGPAETQAMFIALGDVEVLDPETHEVIRRDTATSMLAAYFQCCEAAGLPRANVLQ